MRVFLTATAQATLLYHLQTIDLAIAKRRTRLQEIDAALSQDARIKAAQTTLAQAASALAIRQTRARDLELEAKGLTDKISGIEKRLYSGIVTNPKEMGDLQTEIDSLKRREARLEEDQLESMQQVDDAQTAATSAQKVLDVALVAAAKTHADLIAEKARLDAELATDTARRQTSAAGIEASNLARYDALRPKKRGTAVALLQPDGICAVCGVEQTSTLVQQVRMGAQLVLCASCGRILTQS